MRPQVSRSASSCPENSFGSSIDRGKTQVSWLPTAAAGGLPCQIYFAMPHLHEHCPLSPDASPLPSQRLPQPISQCRRRPRMPRHRKQALLSAARSNREARKNVSPLRRAQRRRLASGRRPRSGWFLATSMHLKCPAWRTLAWKHRWTRAFRTRFWVFRVLWLIDCALSARSSRPRAGACTNGQRC